MELGCQSNAQLQTWRIRGVSHCLEPHSTEGRISVQFKADYIEEHVSF